MHINKFEKDIESISVWHHRFNNKKRGLRSLSKLINISTILWFSRPLTFQKNEETF